MICTHQNSIIQTLLNTYTTVISLSEVIHNQNLSHRLNQTYQVYQIDTNKYVHNEIGFMVPYSCVQCDD